MSVEVESITAHPGELAAVRIMLYSDVAVSALRIPVTIEDNPWITLEEVSFDYTVAQPYFIDTTLLADDNRTEVINILPYIQAPVPTIPPPGGEICRLIFSIDSWATEQFVTIDSLNSPTHWVDASDQWGTSFRPDFVSGGILITDRATGAEEETVALPTDFALDQNFPNPFNPITHIGFSLARPTSVSLEVYDILGRRIASLVSGNFPAGRHTVAWDASGEPSGVYLYRLMTPEYSETRKMLLLE